MEGSFVQLFSRRLVPIVATAIAVGLAAPSVAAVPPLTTFEVSPGDGCVGGVGPPTTQLTVKLHSASGRFEGTGTPTTDAAGIWSSCAFWDEFDPTDVISATDGVITATFTVPLLTVRVNRATDVVSGKGPANSNVDIQVTNCQLYTGCSVAATANRPTSASGDYSRDFTAVYNVRGHDSVRVVWTSPNGDEVIVFRTVPNMSAWLFNSYFRGTAHPDSSVTMRLLTAGGTVRATAVRTGHYQSGNYDGRFRNSSGNPVNAAIGNKVTASFASDASIKLFDTLLTGNPATDMVSGKCLPNGPYLIDVQAPTPTSRTPASANVRGVANGLGNINVSVAISGFDLMSGDFLWLQCRTAKGDELWSMAETP